MASFPTRFAAIVSMTALMTLGTPAEGARISLIRDAEIENTIRTFATPLFTAAGFDANQVRMHIVNDPRLNAFVAGGMNLFLNTGLLLASKSPEQVIGVIAHETGHIAGGHLARTQDALRGASVATILAYVLGAAAIAAGSAEGGAAVILGGQSIAQQTFLQYSRSQEQAADQFAVTVLDETGQSAEGLLEFLEIMANQEVLLTSGRDPYLRSHPLTRDRIGFIRHHVETSPNTGRPPPAALMEAFARMQGKLRGFLDPPDRTLARYPASDTGVEARYARAVAHYQRADLVPAFAEIDSLIAEHPDDPFFHELKGQILFENGRAAESIASYRRAVELLPDAPLLRVGLAQAMVETGDSSVLAEAAEHLETAVRQNQENVRAWRLLSVAYGRTDQPGLSALASAERAFLVGRYGEAVAFAKRAADRLPFGAPGRLRAEDIEHAAENALKKRKKKN